MSWSVARGARRLVIAAITQPRMAAVTASVLAGVSILGAVNLHTTPPDELLTKSGSTTAKTTAAQEAVFGGEPVVVSLRGDTTTLLSGANLTAMHRLEGRLARLPGVQGVFGPGTFVSEAIEQMGRIVTAELGPAAEKADGLAREAVALARKRGLSASTATEFGEGVRLNALGPLREQYEQLLVRLGYLGVPALTNSAFVNQLVLGAGVTPKKRFAWLFPDAHHAVVVVRLKSGLSDAQVRRIRPQIEHLVERAGLRDLRTLVGGAPLVVAAMTSAASHELLRLMPAVVAAMALALLLGLGWRRRALHLLLPAGGAVLLTAGLSWPLGLGFTAATLAALPVILGLAIDYAVQLQARYTAERADGRSPPDAAVAAVANLAPTLLLAGGAMACGFLVLLLSPVPLVGRLGLTLSVGVICSLLAVLFFAGPLMVAFDRAGIEPPRLALPRLTMPRWVRSVGVIVAVGVGVAGLALSAGVSVESDVRKLTPAGMPELDRLEGLQRELGTSGQLRVAITAADVTTPEVLNWMNTVQTRVLASDRRLRPGPNLGAILAAGSGGHVGTAVDVQRLLRLLPSYFVAAVLSKDRTTAELSFGLPLESARDQARTIERLQPLLDGAPSGVTARAAGIVALSAASVSDLQHERPWLLLCAALVIFLVLFAVRRRLDRAVVPLVPALLAGGVTSFVIALADVRLSALSAALDPLVLAVGVEFGVLLEARYHEERSGGKSPEVAAREAAQLLGAPVVFSAATVALGFAVLLVSRIASLQQFGILAAGELVLSVAAAVLLVPRIMMGLDRASQRTARGFDPPDATVGNARVTATSTSPAQTQLGDAGIRLSRGSG